MTGAAILELNSHIHDRVLEFLRPEPRGTLLDVGAGDGTLAERLSGEGFDVRAIDLITRDFRPKNMKSARRISTEVSHFATASSQRL